MDVSGASGAWSQGAIGRLSQALDLRAERQAVLAENVANVDTPGYVARDVPFEQLMAEFAAREGSSGPGAEGARSEPPAGEPGPRFIEDGTVDLVTQMSKLAANAGAYRAATALLRSRLSQLMTAASDGRRS